MIKYFMHENLQSLLMLRGGWILELPTQSVWGVWDLEFPTHPVGALTC